MLLTIKDIAERVQIPPSTVAYYRDRYAEYITPATGSGRKRRYNEAVCDVVVLVAELTKNGKNTTQIKEALRHEYEGVYDIEPVNTTATTTTQQQHLPEVFYSLLERQNELLKKLTDVIISQGNISGEVADLKREVTELTRAATKLSFWEKVKRLFRSG